MENTNKRTQSTRDLTTTAMLIALIVALQAFSSIAARIGLFSFALGLFPATIGSVLYGKKKSLIFGAALGITILATDATAFALYGVNVFATIFVVMLKSVASTFVTATVFEWFGKLNRYIAVVVAAILGPIFNTAIFTAGVCVFFKDFFSQFIDGGVSFITGFLLLILMNFIIEMVINIVLSPIVLRVVDIKKKL
jgi:hypothetical protein